MPSWLVVGAARGIGFEFVKQLSATPTNKVVGIIRSQKTADEINALAKQNSNVHVIEADVFDVESLRGAVAKVEKFTDGKLDVLIYNAYSIGTPETMMLSPTQLTGKETALYAEINEAVKGNILGPMLAINACLPLIRKGSEKKIVYITSGAGDVDMTRISRLTGQIGYAASKAGGNVIIAKYAGELYEEGIKTLSLSPGWVETPATSTLTDPAIMAYLMETFGRVQPNLRGMIPAEESISAMLKVIGKLDMETSGAFLSHHGDKQWLD
ncbi:hypothetical protein LTR62_006593 [Meristemomyces frigidus]|uniref:NAD(P)-binding protein n=1 Tax=Meristemomyces frigidus TaxID=1508187 RepID=A0AAN7TDX3_9PEZI|nr:hypothetical protein LTR62_006593 [Meristemomyces frigidus]